MGCPDFYPRSPCGERQNHPTFRPIRLYFYPRSPCGERPAQPHYQSKNNIFLSTLSLRRATPGAIAIARAMAYFYPRSPCGERLAPCRHHSPHRTISIHALLAESDVHLAPCRHHYRTISIHALLAESDFGRAFWPGLSF